MTASQLKNAILQYAVQGKLVPQNPNDEPAGVLLSVFVLKRKNSLKKVKSNQTRKKTSFLEGIIPIMRSP